ncbi:MAG: type II secretion system protein [Gammaproteobacteria bacterium]|nr:type II secretion system protein [Gammaproteobacteria bacterium]
MKHKQRGFTLIELILFIVGTSILVGTLLLTFQVTLRNTPPVHYDLIATQLADQCMEGFIGERHLLGYSATGLACSASPTLPTICTTLPGYSVSAAITCAPTLTGDTTTSKTVTVTVSGLGSATLVTLFADY